MKAVAHIDANYFYGQIEALFRPDVRGKAFIVGGDQESRKGIVLTKSPSAKRMGVKTGSSVREALGINPNLIILPANYPLYLYFSQCMREIVLEHTDAIKPFGSDEMWCQLYGDREKILQTVHNIRQAIWTQLCLTVSIGVGNNLPYAKLGSDLASENGVFEAWNEHRERVVYPLPVSDLLYVGPQTTKRFHDRGIFTIGDLAKTEPKQVCRILKNRTGESLWAMAAGLDTTTVDHDVGANAKSKSIGNSNTMRRDLVDDNDVQTAFYMLGENVSRQMREEGYEATVLMIHWRDNELSTVSRQMRLPRPTSLTAEMVPAAMELFKRHYNWHRPIRSLGIRGAELIPEKSVYQQISVFDDEQRRDKLEAVERCVDRLRGRFGKYAVQRAVNLREKLKGVNANNDPGDAPVFYVYR